MGFLGVRFKLGGGGGRLNYPPQYLKVIRIEIWKFLELKLEIWHVSTHRFSFQIGIYDAYILYMFYYLYCISCKYVLLFILHISCIYVLLFILYISCIYVLLFMLYISCIYVLLFIMDISCIYVLPFPELLLFHLSLSVA